MNRSNNIIENLNLRIVFLKVLNFNSLISLYGFEIYEILKENIEINFENLGFYIINKYKYSIDTYLFLIERKNGIENNLTLDVFYKILKNPILFNNQYIYLDIYIDYSDKFLKDLGVFNFFLKSIENSKKLNNKFHTKDDISKVSFILDSLINNRIYFDFQPVYELVNGNEVVFYNEVLLRCEIRSKYNLFDCILALEDLDICYFLDYFVVKNSIDILNKYKFLKIGCNISASFLYSNVFWEDILSCIKKQKTSNRLILEITETSFLNRDSLTEKLLINIRKTGTLIALDDFGRGFSNFEVLNWFRFDIVKIDKDYFNDFFIKNDKINFKKIIEKLIRLTDCVIVEGVEDKFSYDFIIQADVVMFQGFYFKKPEKKPSWMTTEIYRLKIYD